jgi:hypothetical protein
VKASEINVLGQNSIRIFDTTNKYKGRDFMFPKNMSEAWKTTLIILSIVIPVIAVLIILLVWYKRTNDKATEN